MRSLIEMSNGELITGADDGSIRRWKNGKPLGLGGDPIPTGQDMVLSLIELKNGELITGGQDGSLRRWKNGTPLGDPIPTGQEGVSSLIKLRNGDLLSVGRDGSLKVFSLNAIAKAACRAIDLEHDQSTLDTSAGRLALQTCKDMGVTYAASASQKGLAALSSVDNFIPTSIAIVGISFLAILVFHGRDRSILARLRPAKLRL
jgi:WD40 repeat protein